MIYSAAERLVDYGLKHGLITPLDVYVVRNKIMDTLRLDSWEPTEASSDGYTADEVLEPLLKYAVEEGLIPDTQNSRDLFDTRLMGLLMPMPREVSAEFSRLYAISPSDATDWYYRFSGDTNYVRRERMKRDLRWTHETEYGTLDVTVNLSKPEKDPRDIAAAKTAKATSYPKCMLCAENAGFAGNAQRPARQNLSPVPITVGGKRWGLQYSPYGYYNEHCIAFNYEHTPMRIDREVFSKLLDIVEYLPHYFVGSNADLPIVGGSILSHEHFQGGRYTFAMERAKLEWEFSVPEYPKVKAGVVAWPMSVIRLESECREQLIDLSDRILTEWRKYTDESAYVFAETDGTPHNTVTPIARKSGEKYTLDLVLRNNITTEDRPLGLYHPAPELHHIKKENIGLIEVMGLAVLPARLSSEMAELKSALLSGESVRDNSVIAHHADWAEELLRRHPELSAENAEDIIRAEVGEVFLRVLLDAGVFKRTEEGKAAFKRFIDRIVNLT
ncbi:MAG: UDP-glucose--hexose-1-phosphate uridylyltransferase [Clostridia bacterium]|nr:UDP-glucose--hexose-1-phosphate uridylyltransferase [Clostridia bacterium]